MNMEITLRTLSDEELRNLIAEAQKELDRRRPQDLVVYTHDCYGYAKHHLGKYKHWAKIIRDVDTTKTNGYAWIGDFLPVTAQHKIPANSIVVEVCGNTITAYRVTTEGKQKIGSASTNGQAAMIEQVAGLLRKKNC